MAKHRAGTQENHDAATLALLAEAWDLGCQAADRAWAYGKTGIEENPYRSRTNQ